MMRYRDYTFNNGAKLRYAKNNISKTTKVDISFDCGARCDTIEGIAHFTEHMFFTGTKQLNKSEITKKYYDFINVNAYTSPFKIWFSGDVFTKEFSDYISLVYSMITESTFSKDAVAKELKVVQQEIVRKSDKHDFWADIFNEYQVTQNSLWKCGALGTKESVATIQSKDVKKFVKKYFIANNLEVYVTSPLSFSKVRKIVNEKLASKLQIDNKFKPLPLFMGYLLDKPFYELKQVDIKKNYIFINFPINRTYQDIEFAKKIGLVLSMMNNGGEGLMKSLRLEKSLVYSAHFSLSLNDKNGLVTLHTNCDKENVNEVLRTVANYLKEIEEKGFTLEQLNNEKRKIDYRKDNAEPSSNSCHNKLFDYKFFGKLLNKKKLDKITRNTTLEECNQLFKEVFTNPTVSLSVYGNISKNELMKQKEFNEMFK